MTDLAAAEITLADAGGFPALPLGNLEALVRGSLEALPRGDWWVPGLRERVGAVLRGVNVDRLADPTQGARPYRVAPASGSPADRALYAVGLAQADRDRAALVHLGVGSMADGSVHEALNLAALLRPTVIFVVAVQPLTDDAPLPSQLATRPRDLAAAFGIPTVTVDGLDRNAVRDAVAAALVARGPHLIEASLLSEASLENSP